MGGEGTRERGGGNNTDPFEKNITAKVKKMRLQFHLFFFKEGKFYFY